MGTVKDWQLGVANTSFSYDSGLAPPSPDDKLQIKEEWLNPEPVLLPQRIITPCLLQSNSKELVSLPLEVTIIDGGKKQVLRTTVPFQNIYGCKCLAKCLTLRTFPDLVTCSSCINIPCDFKKFDKIPSSYRYAEVESALCYTFQR